MMLSKDLARVNLQKSSAKGMILDGHVLVAMKEFYWDGFLLQWYCLKVEGRIGLSIITKSIWP